MPGIPEHAGTPSLKVKTFVSYSRSDLPFVDRLVAALESRGVDVTIDRRDLPLATEFQPELLDFIRQADAIIFVVSQASITSSWCAWEIEQVVQHGKRLVPLLVEFVRDEHIPDHLRKINYVVFTGEHASASGFELRADELARALKTDLEWTKEHTRIGEIARRWNERGADRALLLRGRELDGAERWRDRHPAEAPAPTNLHLEFIAASRNNATRRQRMTVAGSLVIATAAILLSGLAYWQRQVAVRHAGEAATNETRALCELSRTQTARGDTTHAIELGLVGMASALRAGVSTREAETALYQALWRHRELRRVKLNVRPLAGWFQEDSGTIQVLTADRAITLDSELTQTGDRPRGPGPRADSNGIDAETIERRPVARLPSIPLRWSKDRQILSLAVSTTPSGPIQLIRLKRRDLPFLPTGAWSVRDGEVAKAVLHNYSEDDLLATTQFAVVGDSGPPSLLPSFDGAYFNVDPTGRIIMFCRPWGDAFFVPVDAPTRPQISMHQYIKGETCDSYFQMVRYSATENLAAFVPSSHSGNVEQPLLVDARTGIALATLGGHTSTVVAIDISADGQKVLTITDNAEIRLWQARVRSDERLVRKHGGQVLRGEFDMLETAGHLSADYDEHPGLTDRDGFLWGERDRVKLLSQPHDDLLVAHSRDQIFALSKANPAQPHFRTALDAEVIDAVHAPGSSDVYIADSTGAIKRWSTADGSSKLLFNSRPDKILRMTWAGDQHHTLVVVTSSGLLHINPTLGRQEQRLRFPNGQKAVLAEVFGNYLSYCREDFQPGGPPCALLSVATGSTIARLRCERPISVNTRLAVAYCSAISEEIPKLVDISGTPREVAVFPGPATIAATGLRARAEIALAPLERCRRAFISLGGGVVDDLYRGEGLLYDFGDGWEIARTKGDPSTDYQGYGSGVGLPVFCETRALVNYAHDLLEELKRTDSSDRVLGK